MEIKEIAEKLEKGVKAVFENGEYQEYLRFVSGFYNYSANNTMLIYMQRPNASYVAGFNTWKNKHERTVKKGEKAIKIIAPIPRKAVKEVTNENGETEEVEYNWCNYRVVNVFDVSQTEGKELPSAPDICKDLEGNVEGYNKLIKKLENATQAKVEYEEIYDDSHGHFNRQYNKIVVKKGMSQQQTVKTLIHEIAHSMLHGNEGEELNAMTSTKEVQAESVAYIVCNYLGLDTSDYSFGYVVGWSETRGVKELQSNLDVIVKTAKEIIQKVA